MTQQRRQSAPSPEFIYPRDVRANIPRQGYANLCNIFH